MQFDEDTAWLSLDQMADLFDRDKSTISRHIKNIFKEGELVKDSVVANFATTALDGKTYQVDYYNLDVIISVGYRVKSLRGTQFRQWASGILKEYLKKGFAMDDDLLKGLGGGNYFKELLERIRDIRSSEKVMYRQVLDLYATAIDYDPKSEESLQFFKIIQNKLHYAAHGHTASEVIYLSEQELKVLNNLVSAYFDFAELNAIEEREMKMKDYVIGLDRILSGAGRKLLENAGEISHQQAQEKAKIEYKKYKAKTLSDVEKDYLDVIQDLNQQVKKVSRRK
ncbi:hypothetical protein appser13_3050 [Actinobacillus pleuropneumoniae serovar 13 str. N273]|nr:hypothetical protein appser13_3050 [Actinobacillus pleuropneumoniae serovar 13 str. N273]